MGSVCGGGCIVDVTSQVSPFMEGKHLMSVATVIVLVVVFVVLVVAVGVRVGRERALTRYGVAFEAAVAEARFCGLHERKFYEGEYDGVFTVAEVCELRRVFLNAVREDGYRVGRKGLPNMAGFTGYQFDDEAVVFYGKGWGVGNWEFAQVAVAG